MKDGKYIVQSYHGKDAILVHTDGTFETLSKIEFPESFQGVAYPGETIIVETIQRTRPEFSLKDERERQGYGEVTKQLQRMRDLISKERERRALYGGVASIPGDK
jgi:hypothetical protein